MRSLALRQQPDSFTIHRLTVAAVLVTGLVGCAQQGKVVTQLPDPYKVVYREPPAMVLSDPPGAETASLAPIQSESAASPLPIVATVETDPWRPEAAMTDRWTHIVIHHSDSDVGSLSDIDVWHRQKGWENGCGYHFVIGNGTKSGDGEIEVSQRWRRQLDGAHTRLEPDFARRQGVDFQHYNQHGIGIVLVGNFENRAPSFPQRTALDKLVRYLMQSCSISEDRVVGHGDVDQTRCPGQHCGIAEFRQALRLSDAVDMMSAGEAQEPPE